MREHEPHAPARAPTFSVGTSSTARRCAADAASRPSAMLAGSTWAGATPAAVAMSARSAASADGGSEARDSPWSWISKRTCGAEAEPRGKGGLGRRRWAGGRAGETRARVDGGKDGRT